MSSQVERLEHNMVKLTITVPAEDFEKAYVQTYNKEKNKINIQGFRKGRAPLQLVEKMYGPEMFYEGAADILISKAYDEALKEQDIDPVSRPVVDITQIEKGKDFIFTADFAVKPPVELPEYKGVEVTKKTIRVTEKEIDEEVSKEQEKNSRLVTVDRAAEDGDTINLDYAGTVDGEAFEGGTAEKQTLVLGSGQFIPGFEEQLVGTKAGDEKDVVVTFPESYFEKKLSGKEAVFACKINEVQVKEIPEVNDEFVGDVSEFETVKEYRDDLKKKIKERKENQDKLRKQEEVMDKLIEEAVIDVPEAMVDFRVDSIINERAQNLSYSGITMEQYLQYMGTNIESLRENTRPDALKNIKASLILEAIAEKEGFEASEDDMKEQFERLGQAYGLEAEKIEEFLSEDQKEAIREQIKTDKALNLIVDECKATKAEPKKEKEDKEAQSEE